MQTAPLPLGVLGAHGREQGNAHEIFVPVDVIAAFHTIALLLVLNDILSRLL